MPPESSKKYTNGRPAADWNHVAVMKRRRVVVLRDGGVVTAAFYTWKCICWR